MGQRLEIWFRPTAIALVLTACGRDGSGLTAAWEPDESSGVLDPSGDTSGASGSESSGSNTPPGDDETSDAASTGATPEPMPDVPQSTCPRVRVGVAVGNALNVRAEPSSEGELLGELPNNAIVDVLDTATGEPIEGVADWYQIADDDLVGWISGAYAECTFDEPAELEPPDGFYLPLECDFSTTIAQGNDGTFTHQGSALYAYDFSIGLDTPLVAMADGVVAYTFDETGPGDPCYDGGGAECFAYGNLVVLRHGDGSTSLYKHLNAVWVTIDELVPAGYPVGLSGSTGYSTGPHAHVMRMEDCGMAQCQSIPLEFIEAGVPQTGDTVTSENCPR